MNSVAKFCDGAKMKTQAGTRMFLCGDSTRLVTESATRDRNITRAQQQVRSMHALTRWKGRNNWEKDGYKRAAKKKKLFVFSACCIRTFYNLGTGLYCDFIVPLHWLSSSCTARTDRIAGYLSRASSSCRLVALLALPADPSIGSLLGMACSKRNWEICRRRCGFPHRGASNQPHVTEPGSVWYLRICDKFLLAWQAAWLELEMPAPHI